MIYDNIESYIKAELQPHSEKHIFGKSTGGTKKVKSSMYFCFQDCSTEWVF